MTTLYKGDVVYEALVCPLCGQHHCTILRAGSFGSDEGDTYRCLDCDHDFKTDRGHSPLRQALAVGQNRQNTPDPDPRPPPVAVGYQADEPERDSDWSGIDGY